MALSETTVYYLGIQDNGVIELRKTRRIMDGIEIVGEKHARTVLVPGQDVAAQPLKIRQIAGVVWTPAVIAAYLASLPPAQP